MVDKNDMLFPISITKIEALSREEVNEMAGILAFFFANEMKEDMRMATMPLRNESYAEYVINFHSENIRPNRPTILTLEKENE